MTSARQGTERGRSPRPERHISTPLNRRSTTVFDTEFGAAKSQDSRPDFERKADAEAADAIIPAADLESFINQAKPAFSTDNVVAFAKEANVHPGLLVGQLQHRGEIGYQSHRPFLVKVRDHVIQSAETDGWAS